MPMDIINLRDFNEKISELINNKKPKPKPKNKTNIEINIGMDAFLQELPIILLKNDEYIDRIAEYLNVTNHQVKNLIVANEIHRVMTEAIDLCNFYVAYNILGKYKMWKIKDVEENLIKYLEGGDTYTDEKKWQCYCGGDLAHIFNHSKKTIEKMAILYPKAEHWTIDISRKFADNKRFIKLNRGVFSLDER